jgi:hypothetical protein
MLFIVFHSTSFVIGLSRQQQQQQQHLVKTPLREKDKCGTKDRKNCVRSELVKITSLSTRVTFEKKILRGWAPF